jgi:hypothetical protein
MLNIRRLESLYPETPRVLTFEAVYHTSEERNLLVSSS